MRVAREQLASVDAEIARSAAHSLQIATDPAVIRPRKLAAATSLSGEDSTRALITSDNAG